MIKRIEHCGVLIGECGLPGETRADGVWPADAAGMQLSKDRWLLLYTTRRWRGVDDDSSIVYQLRENTPDGSLIKEGFMARGHGDWDALGDGRKFWKEHAHPAVFGVPKGASIAGKPANNANIFVAKWRVLGKVLGEDGRCEFPFEELHHKTLRIEWSQFRLNDAGDDIEIIKPACVMRQVGFEWGERFCQADVKIINQPFTAPLPSDATYTGWIDSCHFDGGRIGACKYRFNPATRLYEWAEVGPLVGGGEDTFSESSLVRIGDGWVATARTGKSVAWVKTREPFTDSPEIFRPTNPHTNSPHTASLCADGVLRLFTGDFSISPHKNGRDPLYVWDIDPAKGFAASNPRVILDSVAATIPIRPEAIPRVDCCRLFPHAGGRVQYLTHRIRTKAVGVPANTRTVVNEREMAVHGVYYAKVEYDRDFPGVWEFGDAR